MAVSSGSLSPARFDLELGVTVASFWLIVKFSETVPVYPLSDLKVTVAVAVPASMLLL